jgi:methylenetetrahydrofolate reductase (NADPH)
MSLRSKLESGQFAITCEVGPPKGTDVSEVMEAAEILKGKVDAANVTDQQSSVMRLGSMVTSHLLLQKGLEPLLQVACRDRNRIALQSDLLSAWVLGIKNVLAITGDLPLSGDHPEAKGVYDMDSVGLLYTIGRLNEGFDLAGKELKGKPAFFAGGVVAVESDTETSAELQIIKMEKKIATGARFFQTQAVYDAGHFAKFMKKVEGFKVPVLAGIVPLKTAGMAKFMNKNIPGIYVPDELIQRMTDAKDKTAMGIQIAADLIKQVKGLCQGVHIMGIGWEKMVPDIIRAAGL